MTIDAMGTQKGIAAQIVEGGADYVLALKENHPNWYEDVTLWMNTEYDAGRLSVLETVEKDHGRLETRRYTLSTRLDWLDGRANWAGPNALGMVESRRKIEIGDKVSIERRYYWCSRPKLAHFSQHCRAQVLGVNTNNNRARTNYSTENLALMRRTALNLIRHHGKPRDSLRIRRLRTCGIE